MSFRRLNRVDLKPGSGCRRMEIGVLQRQQQTLKLTDMQDEHEDRLDRIRFIVRSLCIKTGPRLPSPQKLLPVLPGETQGGPDQLTDRLCPGSFLGPPLCESSLEYLPKEPFKEPPQLACRRTAALVSNPHRGPSSTLTSREPPQLQRKPWTVMSSSACV